MPNRKRLRVGVKVSFGDGRLTATVVEELDHGGRVVEFAYDGIFLEVLESLGEMPLPPYIHEKLDDPDRYKPFMLKKMVLLPLLLLGFILLKICLPKSRQKVLNLSI